MFDNHPFEVTIEAGEVSRLKQRLAETRFPEKETVSDWSQGVPLDYLKDMVSYWSKQYDMQRLASRLNGFPNFLARIDGLEIHYIHLRSPHAGARPLLLSHGWPGSVVEFLNVLEPLTDPEAYGGSAEDAFHVVVPSLPGFGFSEKPNTTGWGVGRIAGAFSQLMEGLGYQNYLAQGGDWGAAVTTAVAQADKRCRAIHLNMAMIPPQPEDLAQLGEEEKAVLASLNYYQEHDSGYSKIQGTRPQTIGYSLVDSPVGLLAWILEKYWAWTDCAGDPGNALSRDDMLDNIMVYWLNAAGASSARLYWESMGSFISGEVYQPTGFSIFPKEIFRSPRHWCERVYKNIGYWQKSPRGGHFAAFEQPEVFVSEIRHCFATLVPDYS